MTTHNTNIYKGIIAPMVTPLLDNDTLDINGLEKIVEHLIRGGVNGLFILGTTGEFSSLSKRIQTDLINKTCSLVNHRIPVLVGISHTSFTESLYLAETAQKAGADAVVITPPYYIAPSQSEFLNYLENITSKISLPLFIYNIPSLTKVMISLPTIVRAAEISGVIGLKDSSTDLAFIKKVRLSLKDRSDFILLTGTEEFLSEFVLFGGHGGVTGGANLFPKLYVELYKASILRDLEKINNLQEIVMKVSVSIYTLGNTSSSYLRGVKCALGTMGICSDFLAQPFERFDEPEKRIIEGRLIELNYQSLL